MEATVNKLWIPEANVDRIATYIVSSLRNISRDPATPGVLARLFLELEEKLVTDELYEKLFAYCEVRLLQGLDNMDNNGEKFDALFRPLIRSLKYNNGRYKQWFDDVFTPRIIEDIPFVFEVVTYLESQLSFEELCQDYSPFVKKLIKGSETPWMSRTKQPIRYGTPGASQLYSYVIHRVMKGQDHKKILRNLNLEESEVHDFARYVVEERAKGVNIPIVFLEDLFDKDDYFDEYVFCKDDEENQRIHRWIDSCLYPQDEV